MGMKPTTTERTSPPREHTFLLAADILKRNRPRKQVGRKWKKQKEKAIETELEQEGKKIRSLRTSQTQEQAVFPRIGRLITDACFSYDVPCHLAFDSAFACRVGARKPGPAPPNRRASKIRRKTSEIDLRRPLLVDL